jgi:hypothetical protein
LVGDGHQQRDCEVVVVQHVDRRVQRHGCCLQTALAVVV